MTRHPRPDRTTADGLPPLQLLTEHNELLGDRAALDRAWREQGYWFFRNVLDRAAIARLRRVYLDELLKHGVIDPISDADAEQGVPYNGAPIPDAVTSMDALFQTSPWRELVADPAIDQFFRRLLDDEPFWVPMVVYRATPPASAPTPTRFTGIHQDGPYSPGIGFRICWIPLTEIDDDVGGLCLAEGLTEEVNRHPVVDGSNRHIPPGDLPPDSWRRTTYRPGDVLLMNRWLPHSGLTNVSGRFRLSLDHRVMGRTEACPVVGPIAEISRTQVSITDSASGQEITCRITPRTYVRNERGVKLFGDGIVEYYRPGRQAILVGRDGDAEVLRPVR